MRRLSGAHEFLTSCLCFKYDIKETVSAGPVSAFTIRGDTVDISLGADWMDFVDPCLQDRTLLRLL